MLNRPLATSQERLVALRQLLEHWAADGILITDPTNRRWLSGFTGSAGSLLVTGEQAVLATDSRYWLQAAEEAPDYELFHHARRPQDTAALINRSKAARLVLEAHHVTVKETRQLQAVEGVSWIFMDNPVEPLRRVKSAPEIKAIRQAAAITDAVMNQVPGILREGLSERQLAWELEKRVRESSMAPLAFPPVVAFGPNSAFPHHTPGERTLGAGDVVLIDMGATLDGYCSDLTRTFLYSAPESGRFQEIYGIVHAAQKAALAGIRPGMDTQEAHRLAATVIAEHAYGDSFTHGLGHSLGLEIHEQPFLSSERPPETLLPGMVLTIEPAIYLRNWGGVRLEDLVLLTANGTEQLSASPYTPYVPIA